MAERIEWHRQSGSCLPKGAVLITRTSRWGNPFVVGRDGDVAEVIEQHRIWLDSDEVRLLPTRGGNGKPRRFDPVWCRSNLHRLVGCDLACACPAGAACHGDELLRRAAALGGG